MPLLNSAFRISNAFARACGPKAYGEKTFPETPLAFSFGNVCGFSQRIRASMMGCGGFRKSLFGGSLQRQRRKSLLRHWIWHAICNACKP